MIAQDEYGVENFKGGLVNYLNKPVNEEGNLELNGISSHKLNESQAHAGLTPLSFKAVNFPEKFFHSQVDKNYGKTSNWFTKLPAGSSIY